MPTYEPYTEIEGSKLGSRFAVFVKWIGWPADWIEKSIWDKWQKGIL